jgi:hypothetical protein
MEEYTVQRNWNDPNHGDGLHVELPEPQGDPHNPYFTPLVRESKRTNFENAQLNLGHLMDERCVECAMLSVLVHVLDLARRRN